MKIFITGSNGLLGQKLLNKLQSNSLFHLIASSKGESRVKNKSNYKYYDLDVTDKLAVSKLICDVIT